MKSEITIAGRAIGPHHPPYIIAEMSGNHNGDIDRALALLDAAKAAGADAVKLQTYTADTITIDHDGPGFIVKGGLWDGRKLYELYQEAHTPWPWHADLFAKGKELGLTVFSTPFDASAIELLEKLGAPAYKIASFEAIDLPLIRLAAQTGKPLIVSTGMAGLGEIQEVVETVHKAGGRHLILLHCVSAYPSRPEDANLRTIPNMREAFGVPIGLSDHSPGHAVAVAATALGAVAIEKHFTLRRADGGVDSAFSLEPEELAALVAGTATAWAALGKVNYAPEAGEKASLVFRRSLYAVAEIAAGAVLSAENIRSIRPGFGLPPKHLPELLGRRAAREIRRGEPLGWHMIEP